MTLFANMGPGTLDEVTLALTLAEVATGSMLGPFTRLLFRSSQKDFDSTLGYPGEGWLLELHSVLRQRRHWPLRLFRHWIARLLYEIALTSERLRRAISLREDQADDYCLDLAPLALVARAEAPAARALMVARSHSLAQVRELADQLARLTELVDSLNHALLAAEFDFGALTFGLRHNFPMPQAQLALARGIHLFAEAIDMRLDRAVARAFYGFAVDCPRLYRLIGHCGIRVGEARHPGPSFRAFLFLVALHM